MEGYMGNGRGIGMGTTMRAKLKRKDIEELDQVSHDFSDFSLSSPARKIRRLDAELPPIMEEEEPEIFTSPPSPSPMVGLGGGGGPRIDGGIVIEELGSDPDPSPPHIDDKAIILFNPANPLLMHRSPSTFSVSVNSDLISGFKDQFIRSAQYGQQRIAGEDDETVRNSNNSNECRAVVPWAPSQVPPASGMEAAQALTELPEQVMKAEDTMEIEDGPESLPQGQSNHGYSGVWGAGEGLPQWQQQHCMIPQPPHHSSTPITWFK